jgi:hypothetical protein
VFSLFRPSEKFKRPLIYLLKVSIIKYIYEQNQRAVFLLLSSDTASSNI